MGLFSRLFKRPGDGSEQDDDGTDAGDRVDAEIVEGPSPPQVDANVVSSAEQGNRGRRASDPSVEPTNTQPGNPAPKGPVAPPPLRRSRSRPPPPPAKKVVAEQPLKPIELSDSELPPKAAAPKPKSRPSTRPKRLPPPVPAPIVTQPIVQPPPSTPPDESQRNTLPIATPVPEKPVEADDFFDFASELDSRFDASRRRTSRPPPPNTVDVHDGVTTVEDMNSVRDLFNDMAVHYVPQIRDFMLELRRADAPTTWIGLCEPTVHKLRSMCDTLSMPELARALDGFAESLQRAKLAPRGIVQGELREDLLRTYDEMIGLLPRAFELGTGRETIIVQLLLLQIPGVRQLTLEKLSRAGLHEFDAFLRADPAELAAVAGIDLSLAQKIVQRFREYRQNVAAVLAEPLPQQERRRVSELTERLREQHEAYEKASEQWSDEAIADKKRLRRERLQTLSEIHVALVRLGEVERVSAMQKMAVVRQLEEVESYLRQFRVMPPL